MRVVMIGTGNVATHLCRALQQTPHKVEQVYSRTEQSARTLAEQCQCQWTCSTASLVTDADVYILSVKDSVLAPLAAEIALLVGDDALMVHTAGSMDMAVLPLPRRGVLYPMQTFSKQRAVDMSRVPFFVEASTEADCALLQALASQISGNVSVLDSARRRTLHLSAVFACNFVNHCYALSAELLQREGVDFSVLLPLIEETCDKVHTLSPHEAQTGPAVRQDENVMARQLSLLDGSPMLQEVYKVMSRSIFMEQNNEL